MDADAPVPGLILAGPPATPGDTAPPAAAATAVRDTLAFLQDYLAAPRLAAVPLAWITAGAAGPGPATDLPAAATAGLIRTAQSEHPARITHLDLDPHTAEDASPGPGAGLTPPRSPPPWPRASPSPPSATGPCSPPA